MATRNNSNVAAPGREVINIPRSRFENEPIVIGVNGKLYQIQRGIDVEVPSEVAAAYRMAQYNESYALAKEQEMRNKSRFN